MIKDKKMVLVLERVLIVLVLERVPPPPRMHKPNATIILKKCI